MTTLIDVSHTVEHGLITYKGMPAPVICDYLSREDSRKVYSPGTEFSIGKIEMVGNTGTYVDSPFHRYAHGKDLSQLDLRSLVNLDTLVVRAVDRKSRAITPDSFKGLKVTGKAVLVHTGWDAHWRTDRYFEGHPFLTDDVAQLLVKGGAVLVGIDSLNIDDTTDRSRPVHSTLLAADVPIVEHLCGLGQLPDRDFLLFAAPVKVRAFGTFPVRAFAVVP
jgi:kynurenine formamidase